MLDLETAELDERSLAQLFADIAAHTELVAVLVKGAAESLAEGGSVTLEDALSLLKRRAVRGVQLRYRYEGREWWDTLVAQPGVDTVRVVRVAH